MEPRIQYAKTSDGVSIAYATTGAGEPLVAVPNMPWSHIELGWRQAGQRDWLERLARKTTLVQYDARGSGLSERDVSDYSLDSRLLDLEAVVDRIGFDKFALFGGMNAGPTAVAYAARHPERVTKLLLWCAYASGPAFWQSPRTRALRAIRETDWELYAETMADIALGRRASREEARRGAEFIRECVTLPAAQQCLSALGEMDVTALLPKVRCPALVLHRRGIPWMPVDFARGLASGMPNAQLVLLEGASIVPYEGDMEAALTAIDEFLGEGEEAAAVVAEPGGFRTILFTDVEGSTALTQQLGDVGAREVLREHERIVREALAAHGGSEVKTLGDGFMASFGSATRALECAVAMQRAFAERNAGAGAHGHAPLQVRIGLNAGEPIAEDDPDGRGDLFGTAVIAAARIAAQAEGGEILASDVVRQLVAGKGFLFADRGDAVLRGFDDPVRLYEVRWRSFDSSADADGSG